MSEADVRRMVAAWEPERPVDDDARSELTAVLVNLVRGARFHTTQGTPLSSYLRCERLIEQLLANLQPRRRKGEPVGPGRKDWTLDAFVGMGSFGEVWLARAAHYPEPRAFKFFTTEGAREWLQRESAALYEVQRQLSAHDNVIRYIDIDSDGEPYPYLVLEYVGGSSLEDWVLSPPGDRAAATAPDLMAGIARGLAAAHRYGICHRDLKPANVLLTGGPIPVAKIADFGLARVEAERPEGSTLLTSGAALVGTRLYLPPEAADPYVSRSAAQDDVFAFGVIWFQVLTGRIERPPYDFADILHQTGSDSRTVRLVSRCLARQDRRFATAGELLEAMEADPPAETWTVPPDCFDVGAIAAEYLAAQSR
jgi:serine/threonine protein kinase